jgi:uncharacterized protein YjdB
MIKPFWSIALVVMLVAGCRHTSAPQAGSSVDCTAQGPTVSPASATVHPGDTLRANARQNPCPLDQTTTFWWKTSDTSVATVDSVAGLVHAKAIGRTTILAIVTANPQITGAMVLTVAP